MAVIGAIAFFTFLVAAMKHALMCLEMTARVNAQRPPGRHVSGWNTMRLARAYVEIAPEGDPLLASFRVWRTVGYVAWAVLVIGMVLG